jgi:hypothetical protein
VVVDTRDWWFGTRVLVLSDWIASVDWNASVLHVDLT